MSSANASTQKVSVILNGPHDWEKWLHVIQYRTEQDGTWQYIDPSLPSEPEMLSDMLATKLGKTSKVSRISRQRPQMIVSLHSRPNPMNSKISHRKWDPSPP